MNWTIVGHYSSLIWFALGPLIGVLVGAYLSSRIQRRHWLGDQKREEYRELFQVMTEAFGELLQLYKEGINDHMDEYNRIQVKVINTIHNRIFTSDAVMMKIDVFQEWTNTTSMLRQGKGNEFSGMFGALTENIRQIALKDIAGETAVSKAKVWLKRRK